MAAMNAAAESIHVPTSAVKNKTTLPPIKMPTKPIIKPVIA
jgi:hypothetical protein